MEMLLEYYLPLLHQKNCLHLTHLQKRLNHYMMHHHRHQQM
jgi:hypothetical protein